MLSIITSKTREVQSRRPRGPLVVNTASPQFFGLVAWYPAVPGMMTAGNGWASAVNTRFALTNNGPTVKYDQLMGRSFLFDDAASQYFTIGSAILTAEPISLTAWFQSDDAAVSGVLIDLHNSASTTFRNCYQLIADSTADGSGVAALSASATALSVARSTNDHVIGSPNLGVAVFFSNSDRRAYCNGTGKATETTSRVPSGVNNASIGRVTSSVPSNYFSGTIYDARIYNRALTDSDVYRLYDLKTRWDLYYPIGRVSYFFAVPAAGGSFQAAWAQNSNVVWQPGASIT